MSNTPNSHQDDQFGRDNVETPTSHQNDPKQNRLDSKAAEVIRAVGGFNYIQTQYQLELAKVINGIENETDGNTDEANEYHINPILQNLLPQISIVEGNEAWRKAFCLVVAFIKRYKMNSTLATMKIEYDKVPKTTGYARSKEVDASFKSILDYADSAKEVTIKDKIKQFVNDVNQEFPDTHLDI
ncbi:hypothetical protein M9Y10_011637 [Tritrichomonas musculus]|uniref:Uncharacterized protein n=1 Tax=Tritrichomonas musculus TaxID=1915356 RepID=A0ABR2GMS6_9EUKA